VPYRLFSYSHAEGLASSCSSRESGAISHRFHSEPFALMPSTLARFLRGVGIIQRIVITGSQKDINYHKRRAREKVLSRF
jgi:hypothetical protein